MKRVVVLGCGYIGRAFAGEAMRRGLEVHALTRNADTAQELEADGIRTVVGDIVDTGWHGVMPEAADLVVNCVSPGGGGLAAYRHAYVEGQHSLVAFARETLPGCVVYTSSTSVYTQVDGQAVGEDDVTDELSPAGALLIEAEGALLGAGLDARAFVLRLAGIYGPGRHHLLDQVGSGDPLPGTGEHFLNLVHRDDVVAAVLAAWESDAAGGVFNICDDSPAPKREVADWLAQAMGLPPATFDPNLSTARASRRSTAAGLPSRRISNRRARDLLGWSPAYPSFREGYGAILDEM